MDFFERKLIVAVKFEFTDNLFDLLLGGLTRKPLDNGFYFFLGDIGEVLLQVILHSLLVEPLQAFLNGFGRVGRFFNLKAGFFVGLFAFVNDFAQNQRQNPVEGVGSVGDVVMAQNLFKSIKKLPTFLFRKRSEVFAFNGFELGVVCLGFFVQDTIRGKVRIEVFFPSPVQVLLRFGRFISQRVGVFPNQFRYFGPVFYLDNGVIVPYCALPDTGSIQAQKTRIAILLEVREQLPPAGRGVAFFFFVFGPGSLTLNYNERLAFTIKYGNVSLAALTRPPQLPPPFEFDVPGFVAFF